MDPMAVDFKDTGDITKGITSECTGETILLGQVGWGWGILMGAATLQSMWPLVFQVPRDDNDSQQKPSQPELDKATKKLQFLLQVNKMCTVYYFPVKCTPGEVTQE